MEPDEKKHLGSHGWHILGWAQNKSVRQAPKAQNVVSDAALIWALVTMVLVKNTLIFLLTIFFQPSQLLKFLV